MIKKTKDSNVNVNPPPKSVFNLFVFLKIEKQVELVTIDDM